MNSTGAKLTSLIFYRRTTDTSPLRRAEWSGKQFKEGRSSISSNGYLRDNKGRGTLTDAAHTSGMNSFSSRPGWKSVHEVVSHVGFARRY